MTNQTPNNRFGMTEPTTGPHSKVSDEKPRSPGRGTVAAVVALAVRGIGVLIAAVVAAVSAAGGVPLMAEAASSDVLRDPALSGIEQPSADLDLGGVTVEDLADELAEFGLTLEITPEIGSLDDDPHVDGESSEAGEFADEFGEEFEEAPAATFQVRGNELVSDGADPALAAKAQSIWDRFARLIPGDQRRMITSFELMGVDYDGAHVYQSESDPTDWVLGVADGLGNDLDPTLIHEFGHLLTLQASQVPPDPDADQGCDTYFTGEGCALSSSTFAQFVERFWPQSILDELDRIEAIDDDDEYYEALERFSAEHQYDFVTEYAATNPGEDLAETFAVFVLEDRPNGDQVGDQKIRFLWDDPSMVQLRDRIRDSL